MASKSIFIADSESGVEKCFPRLFARFRLIHEKMRIAAFFVILNRTIEDRIDFFLE